MIRAVIFDMYETLVTIFDRRPYYSAEMAVDAGVPATEFRRYWRGFEDARTLGTCDLDTALRATLMSLGIRDDALLQRMLDRRLADQRRIFDLIRPEILAMLNDLREKGLCLGLISNCYLEERDRIRASALADSFDVMMLSCEQGLKKPDPEIFRRALSALGLSPDEVLYVGDGGSRELEAASACGLHALQACWFIHEEEPDQPCGRLEGFPHAEGPEDILRYVCQELTAP